jgi:hypothetical protein
LAKSSSSEHTLIATHFVVIICYSAIFNNKKRKNIMAGYGLSKSRITAWKQCPKRLWLQIHQPDLLEVSDVNERSFQIGYEVGEVAQGLFPHGILIEDDHDLLTLPDSFWVTFTPRPDEVKRLLNTQHHLDSTHEIL